MIKTAAESSVPPIKFLSGTENPDVRPFASESIARVYLHAGQVHVSSSGCELVTIVGSCVAVLIWDSKRCFGGGAHFLLPAYEGSGEATARYGSVAMEMLLIGLKQRGCQLSHLEAHVYGGASALTSLRAMGDLGKRNVELAMSTLLSAGIRITEEVTGGEIGRKVVFHTADGSTIIEEIL